MNRGDRREPILRDDADRSAACRRELERQMEARRQESDNQEWGAIRRGWFFGDPELKEELLDRASERVGHQHYGMERQESGEAKAER